MNINSVFTSVPLAELLRALLDVSWKGMIILIFGSMLSALLRRKSAAARHLVWSLAIAGLLTLPVLTFLLPVWRASILPQASWMLPVEVPMASVERETVQPGSSVSRREAVTPASSPLAMFVLLIWLAGSFLTLAQLVFGSAKACQLRRQAKPITDDSWIMLALQLTLLLRSTPITLLKSQHIRMPMTCGVFRAAVLLPVEADGWSEECRRIVLLHELAHVKRRDVLTQFLARIACAMYWFNPLVWWASNRLRVERELACDNQVLRLGTRATDYAHFLIEIAKTLNPGRSSLESAGMASSHLEGRVRAILNPAVSCRDTKSLPVVFSGIAIAALLLPLAAIRVGTKPPRKQNQVLDHLVAEPSRGAPATSSLPTTTRRSNKTLSPSDGRRTRIIRLKSQNQSRRQRPKLQRKRLMTSIRKPTEGRESAEE